jgi:hypothetical protein
MHFQNTRIKSLKNYFFSPLEWLKTCFDAFPDHQNQVLKTLFFNVWSGSKRVFKHFRILPDQQNQVIRKLFFVTSKVLKKLFFNVWSGSKRVLMHFQATRIKSLRKTFFNIWSGKKHVFMHLCVLPDHQNQVLKKLFFSPLEWIKTCFDAFSYTSWPPESSP